jgi:hypothetical protein
MIQSIRRCAPAIRYAAFAWILATHTCAQTPAEAVAQAEVKLAAHDLNGAAELLRAATARNAGDPELFSALGRVDYLRGEIADAEMDFKSAVRLNDKFARAWIGLGRVFEAGSLREKAKICYQKAWREDPADLEAQSYYADTLAPAERLAALERYRDAAGADGPNGAHGIATGIRDSIRQQIEELKWTGDRKLFDTPATQHAEIKLSLLMYDSKRIQGFALPVSINGGKTLHLLMDTGAGGILVNRKAADAAGLTKISDFTFRGIGDEGDRAGQTAFAETVRIGGVPFANCPIGITDRKAITDEDGLVGPEVFGMFLVTVDFEKMLLKLDPLPPRKSVGADQAWQDREVAPELTAYSPFWHVGHEILLPIRVNDARPVLFAIDTGSSASLIDPDYARQFNGLRSEELVTVTGISGKVNKVQSSGFLTLGFGHYRQGVPGILAVPLTRVARDSPRITGLLGITTLLNFRMRIDYRDSLIDLEYVGPKY